MRVGLIDVDSHNWPNLCLMKLSAWHKSHGDVVEWWNGFERYDRVYMSKVFTDEYSADEFEPANAEEIIKGGTGYGLDNVLPDEVAHSYPDYSLYPEATRNTAYGFLTRGCPRACGFCIVSQKEGRRRRKVADLSEFWRGQKYIKLLDPNLLACPQHMELIEQLTKSGARVDFTQGIDARCITRENAEALVRVKTQMMHFAMDRPGGIAAVKRGLEIYADALDRAEKKWRGRPPKVYVLTNFETSHEQDMERIHAVQSVGFEPYVMIYNKSTAPQITRDLQRWANNPIIYHAQPDFKKYRRRACEAI